MNFWGRLTYLKFVSIGDLSDDLSTIYQSKIIVDWSRIPYPYRCRSASVKEGAVKRHHYSKLVFRYVFLWETREPDRGAKRQNYFGDEGFIICRFIPCCTLSITLPVDGWFKSCLSWSVRSSWRERWPAVSVPILKGSDTTACPESGLVEIGASAVLGYPKVWAFTPPVVRIKSTTTNAFIFFIPSADTSISVYHYNSRPQRS